MSLHAVWVHGNVARTQFPGDPPIMQAQDARADGSIGGVPWTDIVGLPQGPRMVFRGRDRSTGPFGTRVVPQRSTFFHFPLPTPVIEHGVRANLLKVFVLWTADPGVALQEVHAFDGPNAVAVPFPRAVGGGRDGRGGLGDLIEGLTMFTLAAPTPIFWGLGISLGFGFGADGNVTFTAAGADFDVPGR